MYKEIDESSEKIIIQFLRRLSKKLSWILLLEQTKINNILNVAETLMNALESKNNYQSGHSKNVADIVIGFIYTLSKNDNYKNLIFNEDFNFSGYDILRIRLAALLHDVGKFTMSNESFEKPRSSMSDIEKCKRDLHPYYTYKILSNNLITKNIAQIAAFHHERYDNKGHPWGLKQNEISIESQIISFADIIDSSARERPNKYERDSVEDILIELMKDKAKNSLSPAVYRALLGIVSEYRDSPENSNLSKIPKIKRLLGITKADKRIIEIQNNSSFESLFNDFITEKEFLKPDQWLVMVMIHSENDLEFIHLPLLENEWFKFTEYKNKKRYCGVYFSDTEKELVYDFCTRINNQFQRSKIAVIFLDSEMLYNRTINNYIIKLEREIESMDFGDRWRLLMI